MKRTEIKRRPLSDTTIEKLEPESKEYSEHDGNNLYLRVRPNGNKDWRLRYKNELNKWTWKGIGGYPAISGKLARTKAQELRDLLAQGKRIDKAELTQSYALTDLINEWLAQRTTLESTTKRDKGGLYRHVIPYFGNRDYRTIEPYEWLEHFTQRQQETGSLEYIRRVCRLCHQFYTYAKMIKKTVQHNPLDDVCNYLQRHEPENMKHIDPHQLPQLIADIKAYPSEQGRYALLYSINPKQSHQPLLNRIKLK